MENIFLTSLTTPEIRKIFKEELESYFENNSLKTPIEKPKYVDINGAAKILSKSPNAIRVQMSLGNIKSFKKGSRNYFEVEYLENWLAGKDGKI
jgi:hypothetical protein